jgi:predicted HicB family RNase H-like nuclease
MMEYKGYIGKVEIDEEAGILYGEVINVRDVITFEGTTVDEIQQAFRDSVDDYLDFCAQRGESPEKPFSGKFVVRLPAELPSYIAKPIFRPSWQTKA